MPHFGRTPMNRVLLWMLPVIAFCSGSESISMLMGMIFVMWWLYDLSGAVERLDGQMSELTKREKEKVSRGPEVIKDPFGQDWDPLK